MHFSSRLDFQGLWSINSKLSPPSDVSFKMVGSNLFQNIPTKIQCTFSYINSWIYFIVVMIFTHLFWLQKSKNDIIQLNDGRNSTDPNLDARLFTFFTGDTQTVVVVGALLPLGSFLQVGEVRVKHHDFEAGGFPTSTPKVWKFTRTFKNGRRSRLARLPGQLATRTRLLHPHFRFIRQRRFRVVRPRMLDSRRWPLENPGWLQVTFYRLLKGGSLNPF